ncbi:hypothetical protein L226DRAFT_561828 [Lentinus tigrinus ALCF2SS1-7]|uniref:uncharacterized protein n=1 Tax=Lentinus tigrinus ALCF2SS1-7 TaxID=1328758 RepID=UPI001165F6EC|nr:hypothetical protein L226DRAFT_561828 [Lentinus tigrinus ALCF2SS1-7]
MSNIQPESRPPSHSSSKLNPSSLSQSRSPSLEVARELDPGISACSPQSTPSRAPDKRAREDYATIILLFSLGLPYLVLVALLPILARLILLRQDHTVPDPYSTITCRGDLVTTAIAVGLAGYVLVGSSFWLFPCYPRSGATGAPRRGWIPRAFIYLLFILTAFFSELITMRLLWTELVKDGLTSERGGYDGLS